MRNAKFAYLHRDYNHKGIKLAMLTAYLGVLGISTLHHGGQEAQPHCLVRSLTRQDALGTEIVSNSVTTVKSSCPKEGIHPGVVKLMFIRAVPVHRSVLFCSVLRRRSINSFIR
jgi:hypothetical protein